MNYTNTIHEIRYPISEILICEALRASQISIYFSTIFRSPTLLSNEISAVWVSSS